MQLQRCAQRSRQALEGAGQRPSSHPPVYQATHQSIQSTNQSSRPQAAYMFYTVPGATPLQQLVNDALILAAATGHDVFNALDIFENSKILKGGSRPQSGWLAAAAVGGRGRAWVAAAPRRASQEQPTQAPKPAAASAASHLTCAPPGPPPTPGPTREQSSSLAWATASCATTCSTGGWRRRRRPPRWAWSCSRQVLGTLALLGWAPSSCSGRPGPACAGPCAQLAFLFLSLYLYVSSCSSARSCLLLSPLPLRCCRCLLLAPPVPPRSSSPPM